MRRSSGLVVVRPSKKHPNAVATTSRFGGECVLLAPLCVLVRPPDAQSAGAPLLLAAHTGLLVAVALSGRREQFGSVPIERRATRPLDLILLVVVLLLRLLLIVVVMARVVVGTRVACVRRRVRVVRAVRVAHTIEGQLLESGRLVLRRPASETTAERPAATRDGDESRPPDRPLELVPVARVGAEQNEEVFAAVQNCEQMRAELQQEAQGVRLGVRFVDAPRRGDRCARIQRTTRIAADCIARSVACCGALSQLLGCDTSVDQGASLLRGLELDSFRIARESDGVLLKIAIGLELPLQ